MKVKIGHTIYDPHTVPIMLMFDDGDRELIANIPDDNRMIAFAPDSMSEFILKAWMHGKVPWTGEVKGTPAPIGASPLAVEKMIKGDKDNE
jgi:hypothetical protein